MNSLEIGILFPAFLAGVLVLATHVPLGQQVLNRGIARGQLRANLDQDLVTELLLGPLWSRTLITPAPTPPELMAQLVDTVLDGIRAP